MTCSVNIFFTRLETGDGVSYCHFGCMNTAILTGSQSSVSNIKGHGRPAVDRRNFWRSTVIASIRLTVMWLRDYSLFLTRMVTDAVKPTVSPSSTVLTVGGRANRGITGRSVVCSCSDIFFAQRQGRLPLLRVIFFLHGYQYHPQWDYFLVLRTRPYNFRVVRFQVLDLVLLIHRRFVFNRSVVIACMHAS